MKTWPLIVALRANFDMQEQFVTYATEGNRKGCLEMSSKEGLYSSKTMFAIEPAGEGLVHIRCCYNNKYLCRASSVNLGDDKGGSGRSPDSCIIALGANEAVGKRLAWNCTLFEIHFHDGEDDELETENVVSLVHVGTKYGVVVIPNDKNKEDLSLVMRKLDEDEEPFHFTAMRSVPKLPQVVNFIGDNDYYLHLTIVEGRNYNNFGLKDGKIPEAIYNVYYENQSVRPVIRVQSAHNKRYWMRSPNWIWSDSTDLTWTNRDTLFEVVHLSGNEIALRNLGNNRFCKRLTADGKISMLNAASTNIDSWARIKVQEPVISRLIDKVDYKLQDAKLIDHAPILTNFYEHTNPHYDTNQEEKPKFEVTLSTARSWSETNTITTGLTMTITAGLPSIGVGGGLTVGTEISQSLTWGQEVSESITKGTESTIIIKPRTKAIIRCYVLEASYDIPFSYQQTDITATGDRVVKSGTDGIFRGLQAYNYKVEPEFFPLDP